MSRNHRSPRRRIAFIAAVLACACAATLVWSSVAGAATVYPPKGHSHTLVFIKGLFGFGDYHEDCMDTNPSEHIGGHWRELTTWLAAHQVGYEHMVYVKTYDSDTKCNAEIKKWGPEGYTETPSIDAEFTQNTPIEDLSYHLAWYLYYNYTVEGESVDIVAHSMGGIIARTMMLGVRDELMENYFGEMLFFPPELLVRRVATAGTPHKGANEEAAGSCAATLGWVQCQELRPESDLITKLRATANATNGGAEWATFGAASDELMGCFPKALWGYANYSGCYNAENGFDHGDLEYVTNDLLAYPYTEVRNNGQSSACSASGNYPGPAAMLGDFVASPKGTAFGGITCSHRGAVTNSFQPLYKSFDPAYNASKATEFMTSYEWEHSVKCYTVRYIVNPLPPEHGPYRVTLYAHCE